jgi:hypothetical protein
MRKTILFFLTVIILLIPSPVLAAGGSITQLSVAGGSQHNDTIVISSAGNATSKLGSSNLYYRITSPNNTLVATHSTTLPPMKKRDTFTDSWSTTNAGWPSIGTYTVTLCWSNGGSTNCDIDFASTTFYSVPTLGWELTLAGAVLLIGWLLRRRKDFELLGERVNA